jgi:hypothetical protein
MATLVDELSPFPCSTCGHPLRLLVANERGIGVFGGLVCSECLRVPEACTCNPLPAPRREELTVERLNAAASGGGAC